MHGREAACGPVGTGCAGGWRLSREPGVRGWGGVLDGRGRGPHRREDEEALRLPPFSGSTWLPCRRTAPGPAAPLRSHVCGSDGSAGGRCPFCPGKRAGPSGTPTRRTGESGVPAQLAGSRCGGGTGGGDQMGREMKALETRQTHRDDGCVAGGRGPRGLRSAASPAPRASRRPPPRTHSRDPGPAPPRGPSPDSTGSRGAPGQAEVGGGDAGKTERSGVACKGPRRGMGCTSRGALSLTQQGSTILLGAVRTPGDQET